MLQVTLRYILDITCDLWLLLWSSWELHSSGLLHSEKWKSSRFLCSE